MSIERRELLLDSRANEYIIQELDSGNSLARAIPKAFDILKGRVVTALPQDVNATSIYDFETGGKLPKPPRHSWKKATEHGVLVPVPSMISWVEQKLTDFLSKNEASAIVIENYILRRDDSLSKSQKSDTFSFGQEMYHFVLASSAKEGDVKQALQDASSAIPSLVCICTSTGGYPLSRYASLSEQELVQLADETRCLGVRAYDGESFLWWTP